MRRLAFALLLVSACDRTPTRALGPRESVDGGGATCVPTARIVARAVLPTGGILERRAVPAGSGQVVQMDTADPGERTGRLVRRDLRTGSRLDLAPQVEGVIEANEKTAIATSGGRELGFRGGGVVDLGPAPARGSRFGAAFGSPARRIDGTRVLGCATPFSLTLHDSTTWSVLNDVAPHACPIRTFARNGVALLIQGSLGSDSRFVEEWEPEDPAPPRTAADLTRRPAAVLFRERIFTIGGRGEVVRRDRKTGSVETFEPGPCAWLDATDESLVMGCAPFVAPAPEDLGLGMVTQLIVVDDAGRRTLPTGGKFIVSPRLGDGFVAWLAYSSPRDLCQFRRGAGALMVMSLAGGDPVEVGPVDTPCLCCDALWPEPSLEVRGDTLVYNYATPGTDAPGMQSEAAVVVEPGCL